MVIDKVAPYKEVRFKNNTQDWFDDEVAKAIKLRDKCLVLFKITKLHIDEDTKYNTLKLIKARRSQFCKTKVKENVGKSKELWKNFKFLALPSKKISNCYFCLEKKQYINS